jgi:hypothetical protein
MSNDLEAFVCGFEMDPSEFIFYLMPGIERLPCFSFKMNLRILPLIVLGGSSKIKAFL